MNFISSWDEKTGEPIFRSRQSSQLAAEQAGEGERMENHDECNQLARVGGIDPLIGRELERAIRRSCVVAK